MNLLKIDAVGCTLTCSTAGSPATPGTLWWWLQASGESQRYAAFRTAAGDTPENLRPRLLAYYDQLLADRARPRLLRQHWSQRGAKPADPDAAPKA